MSRARTPALATPRSGERGRVSLRRLWFVLMLRPRLSSFLALLLMASPAAGHGAGARGLFGAVHPAHSDDREALRQMGIGFRSTTRAKATKQKVASTVGRFTRFFPRLLR